jgi:peptide/nickel transport system permease protein
MVPPAEPSSESTTGIDTGTDPQSEQSGQFETVSLESGSGVRGLLWLVTPILSGLVLLVLVASGTYSVLTEASEIPVAGQEFDVLNWMYGLGLLFVGIVVTNRVVSSPERAKHLIGNVRQRRLVLVSSVCALLLFVTGSIAPFITGEPEVSPLVSVQPPVWSSVSEVFVPTCQGTIVDGQCQGTMNNPLGTNPLGQDVLGMSWLGLNTALQVAVTSSVLAATLGIVVGVLAGYRGGWIDELLMRYVDIQRALPAFFLYILLILKFGRSYPLMILVFGLLSWGGIARLVRSEVTQLQTTSFVKAAQLSGAGSVTIIRRHILPSITGTVLTAVAVLFAKFVVYEAALAFLTLTDISVVSLGNEIAAAVGRKAGDNALSGIGGTFDWWTVPWIIYVPAGVLCTLLLVVSFLGDRAQELVDPQK